MQTNVASIIEYTFALLLMTYIAIYLKRTQPPQKVFFGLPMSTLIKLVYVGMAIFGILIIVTLLQ